LIGRNHPLVDLIHKKTKIKKLDIQDVINAMPECLPEAFLILNPEERKPVDMGGISMFWKRTGWGPSIVIKPIYGFKIHFTRMRLEKKHPLAALLYDLMHPKSKERAHKKANKLINNINT